MKKEYNSEIFAKTFHGLEDVLYNELISIGAKNVTKHIRGVSFNANDELLYMANYHIRTSLCFLKKLFSFKADNDDIIYQRVLNFPWESIFNLNRTFAVEATINSKFFNHSKYIALKTKDAIADRFRKIFNKRPDVDVQSPEIIVNVHINHNICNVSLNSSGEPLFKRGYRVDHYKAPLNEILAAGIIMLSGWDKKSILIDPMCGSGTILIEAALLAKNIPPGYYRESYSFQNWKNYDENSFHKIKKSIDFSKNNEIKIIGNDISNIAINSTRRNINKAGLINNIVLYNDDFFKSILSKYKDGIVITNPPYGKRIEKDNIEDMYKQIGDELKHKYTGFSAWILSSNFKALKCIGLKPEKKITLYNGQLECKLQKYQLYKGSLKRN